MSSGAGATKAADKDAAKDMPKAPGATAPMAATSFSDVVRLTIGIVAGSRPTSRITSATRSRSARPPGLPCTPSPSAMICSQLILGESDP